MRTSRGDRRRALTIRNYADAREAAHRTLPRLLFEHIDGGSEDEITLRRNVDDLRGLTLLPRMGTWVLTPETETNVLGSKLSMPIMTAPCGGMRIVHPDGDIGVARGAAAAATTHIVAAGGGFSLEDVRASSDATWFQLYKFFELALMEQLVRRARDAGYPVLVVTMDTQTSGLRERDYRNGFDVRMRVTPQTVRRMGPQLAARPRWSLRYWRDGMPFEMANLATAGPGGAPLSVTEMLRGGTATASPTWEELGWIRENWSGKLVVKGILAAEDARRAVTLGADGVVVSNHGGRQLDGAPSTVSVLAEIVDAVGNAATVMMDGGIRRGADVVKALAIGASAVLVGRPAAYGLAAGGLAGATRVLENLRADLIRAMQLMGCPSVHALDRSWLHQPISSPQGRD